MLFVEPVASGGPVVRLVGSVAAAWFYASVFFAEAAALLYAEVTHKKKFKLHVLFAIYLTCIFTILLEFVLLGFTIYAIDNIILAFVAGWMWLRWKMLTQYVDPLKFEQDVDGLRPDSPPSRKYR